MSVVPIASHTSVARNIAARRLRSLKCSSVAPRASSLISLSSPRSNRPRYMRGLSRLARTGSDAGLAETVVVHGVRPEIADRIDPPVPDGEHEDVLVVVPQMDVTREATAGEQFLSLEAGRARGRHSDSRAPLGRETGRLRPVVGQSASGLIDGITRHALPATAVDQ